VVYSGALYHLLPEEDTYKLTKRISSWLGTGGIFFGHSSGVTTPDPIHLPGISQEGVPEKKAGEQVMQYLHSANSFKAMLEKNGFININMISVDRNIGLKSSSVPLNSKYVEQDSKRGFLVWYGEKR